MNRRYLAMLTAGALVFSTAAFGQAQRSGGDGGNATMTPGALGPGGMNDPNSVNQPSGTGMGPSGGATSDQRMPTKRTMTREEKMNHSTDKSHSSNPGAAGSSTGAKSGGS